MPFLFKILVVSGLLIFLSPPSESHVSFSDWEDNYWPIPYKNDSLTTLILLKKTPYLSPEKYYLFGDQEEPMSLREALDLQKASAVLEIKEKDFSSSISPFFKKDLELACQKSSAKRLIIMDYGKKCHANLDQESSNHRFDFHAQQLRRLSDLIHEIMPHLQIDLYLAQSSGRVIPIPHKDSWTDLSEIS